MVAVFRIIPESDVSCPCHLNVSLEKLHHVCYRLYNNDYQHNQALTCMLHTFSLYKPLQSPIIREFLFMTFFVMYESNEKCIVSEKLPCPYSILACLEQTRLLCSPPENIFSWKGWNSHTYNLSTTSRCIHITYYTASINCIQCNLIVFWQVDFIHWPWIDLLKVTVVFYGIQVM